MDNSNEPGSKPATDAPADPAPTKPEPGVAQSAPQVPSKGRVVMYYAHINDEIVEHTALVVHVWGDGPDACVNLAVFDSNGTLYSKTSVSKGGPDHADTWGWPRRVS